MFATSFGHGSGHRVSDVAIINELVQVCLFVSLRTVCTMVHIWQAKQDSKFLKNTAGDLIDKSILSARFSKGFVNRSQR